MHDYVFKSGLCRGQVIDISGGPPYKRVCYVYGKTLEEMRKRKRLIAELLYKEEGYHGKSKN